MKFAVVVALVSPVLAIADPDRVAAITDERVDAPPLPPSQPASALEDVIVERQARAGSSTGLFANTALTVPSGHAEISTRASKIGFIATLAAGATPTTELWFDAGRVWGEDGDGYLKMYAVGIKQVIGHGPRYQSAFTASVRKLSADGGDELDSVSLVALGGTMTGCTEGGHVMFSGSLSVVAAAGAILPQGSLALSAGNSYARVQLEVAALGEAVIGFGGLRVGVDQVAIDLGVLTLAEDEEEEGGRYWLPFGGLTGRM